MGNAVSRKRCFLIKINAAYIFHIQVKDGNHFFVIADGIFAFNSESGKCGFEEEMISFTNYL